MQYASVASAREIPKKEIPKQVIIKPVVVRKRILQHLIPYLQIIGFILYVCIANGVVEYL